MNRVNRATEEVQIVKEEMDNVLTAWRKKHEKLATAADDIRQQTSAYSNGVMHSLMVKIENIESMYKIASQKFEAHISVPILIPYSNHLLCDNSSDSMPRDTIHLHETEDDSDYSDIPSEYSDSDWDG